MEKKKKNQHNFNNLIAAQKFSLVNINIPMQHLKFLGAFDGDSISLLRDDN